MHQLFSCVVLLTIPAFAQAKEPSRSTASSGLSEACIETIARAAFVEEARASLMEVGTSIKLLGLGSPSPVGSSKQFTTIVEFEHSRPNDGTGPAFHSIEVKFIKSNACSVLSTKLLVG